MPAPKLLILQWTPLPPEVEWRNALPGLEIEVADEISCSQASAASSRMDCVLIAGTMPDIQHALDLLDRLQVCDPHVPVLFWDSEMRATDAVRLVRAGAFHCLGYRDSLETLRSFLDAAIEERRAAQQRRNRATDKPEAWRRILVGESRAMQRVVETIRLVGPRRCTVLISGSTGSGKEMATRALHMASPRAAYPLVSVNCSSLPDNLLEAELFGHVKGAFTGAVNLRIGRFEQANKGTIFLDEIADMPLDLQAKLLRVLQEREIQRLGSSETIRVDVRVIAASNADLLERVRQGRFREDLYYRLNVVPLAMPPLEDRTADIPLLVEHFLKKICQAEGISLRRVTPETMSRLQAARWPGNVRQLENAVEMAVAMSGDREDLYPADFGLAKDVRAKVISLSVSTEEGSERLDFNAAVGQFERSMLERALARTLGNKTAAAELLGIKRTTLIMKLRSFDNALIA